MRVVKRRVVVRRIVVKRPAPAIQRSVAVPGSPLILLGLGMLLGFGIGAVAADPPVANPYGPAPTLYGQTPPEIRAGRRSVLDHLIAFFTDLRTAIEKKPEKAVTPDAPA